MQFTGWDSFKICNDGSKVGVKCIFYYDRTLFCYFCDGEGNYTLDLFLPLNIRCKERRNVVMGIIGGFYE